MGRDLTVSERYGQRYGPRRRWESVLQRLVSAPSQWRACGCAQSPSFLFAAVARRAGSIQGYTACWPWCKSTGVDLRGFVAITTINQLQPGHRIDSRLWTLAKPTATPETRWLPSWISSGLWTLQANSNGNMMIGSLRICWGAAPIVGSQNSSRDEERIQISL